MLLEAAPPSTPGSIGSADFDEDNILAGSGRRSRKPSARLRASEAVGKRRTVGGQANQSDRDCVQSLKQGASDRNGRLEIEYWRWIGDKWWRWERIASSWGSDNLRRYGVHVELLRELHSPRVNSPSPCFLPFRPNFSLNFDVNFHE